MKREESIQRLTTRTEPWDVLVIGGGATGVGIALDAASRGLQVALVEQADFGKGTSSRSTKLVHGGVRYLRQGNITLVRDALRERTRLRENAPHLVHDVPFLIPCHSYWQRFFYGVGLKVYDFLATGNSFGRSRGVSARQAVSLIHGLNPDRLRGGVVYHDGQFDDARLLIDMAQTASNHGATFVNYAAVTQLLKESIGKISAAVVEDRETGTSTNVSAKCIINAAGPFCDEVRRLDDPTCEKMVAASQGVHLVLPHSFFPGRTAMIVPKTSDGRVVFVIPWHDHTIVGTTDTPIKSAVLEPTAQAEEIEFLLHTVADYLTAKPTLDDVLCIYTGIRPLVKGDKSAKTASLSRDHVIRVAASGLLTITGGKWTTVRKMAEDCVDRAVETAHLKAGPCKTDTLHIDGHTVATSDDPLAYYGANLQRVEQLEAKSPDLSKPLHDELPYHWSDVVWAVRNEMARTVEDVLARRTRALFLNSRAAVEVAPEVAQRMAIELNQDQPWQQAQLESFAKTSQHFVPGGS